MREEFNRTGGKFPDQLLTDENTENRDQFPPPTAIHYGISSVPTADREGGSTIKIDEARLRWIQPGNAATGH
jgi:hypothetical protein